MQALSKIARIHVPADTNICVLGIYPENCVFSSEQLKLTDFGLLQAADILVLENGCTLKCIYVGQGDGIMYCTGMTHLYC